MTKLIARVPAIVDLNTNSQGEKTGERDGTILCSRLQLYTINLLETEGDDYLYSVCLTL